MGIPFASPGRLSVTIRPTAPAACARSAFVTNAHAPRWTRATVSRSEPAGSGFARLFGSEGGPHRNGLSPSELTSTSVAAPAWRALSSGSYGTRTTDAGAPAAVADSVGVNTWSFDTAATVIASGATPGDPTVPRPKSSRSFPAEMTGTTPAAATLWTASISTSVDGSLSGPP